MTDQRPIRVLHVLSILQEDPVLLPVPPIAGCAPCWNIYRLHETLAAQHPASIKAEVVSPCSPNQFEASRAYPQQARYRHVVFSETERRASHRLHRSLPLSAALLRRTLHTNTWLEFRYLESVRRYWEAGAFDLLILDDGPQNLNFLSHFVPREKLVFLMRGQTGMSRRYLHRAGAIFVTNENLAEYARGLLDDRSTAPSLFIVPNSLGEHFANVGKVSRAHKQRRRNIIFAGRFVADKGVRELVEAFHIVQEQFPDARLQIVGGARYSEPAKDNNETDYEREVKALASSLSDGAVSFVGQVPYEQMPQMYLSADLAVFPSVCLEGFGMVALEAMRCGLPVIVSNRPGFTSFVEHEKNGLVVDDPTDAQVLARAITSLMQDPARATRLAIAAEHTAQAYTPEAAAKAFTAAVEQIVLQRGNRSE